MKYKQGDEQAVAEGGSPLGAKLLRGTITSGDVRVDKHRQNGDGSGPVTLREQTCHRGDYR